ncbi:RNA polymerase sigma-70 factor, ECF subfamily [Frankineae bacterium MT45]|nr:RNA polymerase sigma-70 factor, ECF subfamily [Frankineae bacterium MT45]
MVSTEGVAHPLDADSARWLDELNASGRPRESAVSELYALLLRIARSELHRRGTQTRLGSAEVDDLAHQATADALLAITAKLGQFRGESRFTTWAYRFVILEVSRKLGRHFWRNPPARLGVEEWERLPDRFGLEPSQESEWRGLIDRLRSAVESELTPHQRRVFVAIVLTGIPLDALAVQLDTTRNALYKTMFDARGKLRACLAADGYLEPVE